VVPQHQVVQQGWDPAVFRRRAATIGPPTPRLIETIFQRTAVPQQVFRRCPGIRSLAQRYAPALVEAAAQRALQAEALTYEAVQAFGAAIAATAVSPSSRPPQANVRGAEDFSPPAPPES
jgi:hypothetical protein